MTTRTLSFGGSFNPIHHAHLICARAAAEALGFEQILLIPSAQPPHKPGATDLAPPADRLAMCRLAVEGDALFDVTDLELTRTGPSYTIDTVRELKRRGWREVHWLIGADMAAYLPNWHEPLALLKEVHFWLLARPGWALDWSAMPPEYRHLGERVIPAPLIDLRATTIRERIVAGKSIAYLTPEPVIQYIRGRRLYQAEVRNA
jgi:nicotinate-nucleotide adenylyltransferase